MAALDIDDLEWSAKLSLWFCRSALDFEHADIKIDKTDFATRTLSKTDIDLARWRPTTQPNLPFPEVRLAS
jgi:hypothetical protein